MLSKHLSKKQNAICSLTLFTAFMIFLRVQITQDIRYLFLVWNLFLALIPYIISLVLVSIEFSKIKFFIIVGIWLLFLPNAPYLITDFIHFHQLKSDLIWYDLFTFFCFALTGLLLGIFSMFNIYTTVLKIGSVKLAQNIIPVLCFLSGFGVYLGRFLRFNSWDIIANPFVLVTQSLRCFSNSDCWHMTLGFGCLQWLVFICLKNYVLDE